MGGEERKVWVGRRGRCGWGGEEGVGGVERKVWAGMRGRCGWGGEEALRDIVSYAVICRVCPRHGMQIHIQTCTCADQYAYSYLDMSMSSAVCRWVLLGLSIGCVSHPYREQQFSP